MRRDPSREFKALVEELIIQYRPTLEALAAFDEEASEEEIDAILDRQRYTIEGDAPTPPPVR